MFLVLVYIANATRFVQRQKVRFETFLETYGIVSFFLGGGRGMKLSLQCLDNHFGLMNKNAVLFLG